MPKRKTPEEKPEEQFKRFVETAKELGVDESGKPLTDAFTRVVADKKTPTKPEGGRSRRAD